MPALRKLYGNLSRPLAFFLATFNEARCPVCLAPTPRPPRSAAPALCAPCRAALARKAAGFCSTCGEFFAHPGLSGVCAACQQKPRPWGKLYFHAAYAGELRALLHQLKFGAKLHLAPTLGALLAEHPGLLQAQQYDAIIPIPLHPSRLTQRGFNQALELARPLAAALQLPINHSLLKRTTATRMQNGLTRAQRAKNIRGAFSATPLSGQRLLLLDDIMTTGATLAEASNCLLKAGAARVDVAVIARTPAKNMCAEL